MSGIFNAGTGESRTFMDIATTMQANKELWGRDIEVKMVPFPEALVGKYQAYTEADLDQLRAAGYDGTFTSLEDGVRAYAELLVETGGRLRREG